MIPYQRGQLETFRCCLTSPKDATDKYEAHSDSNTAEVAQQFSRKNTPQPGRLAPQAGQTALPSNTASHQPCKHVFLLERGPMGQTKAPPCAHCNASALHACLCLASPRGPSWGTLNSPGRRSPTRLQCQHAGPNLLASALSRCQLQRLHDAVHGAHCLLCPASGRTHSALLRHLLPPLCPRAVLLQAGRFQIRFCCWCWCAGLTLSFRSQLA